MKKIKVKGIKIDLTQQKSRLSLTFLLACIVFLVLIAAIALAALSVYLIMVFDVIGETLADISLPTVVMLMALISLVIGGVITMLLGRFPLKPINKLVNGMNSLAAGNFKTRIRYGGPIGNHPTFNEITLSFNKLAEELENTEVLRRDFINNFSHEFKTPIVSIAGFAKLLKKADMTDEQRRQYLDAIEEEALRLSDMATNVLNMNKVENQSILSDISEFNLSEQIRSAVLLLENKWTEKNIDLQLDFDEHYIEASEEFLKQVWINLIDNAVKFTPEGGTVSLDISETKNTLCVTVTNTGSDIPEDKIDKIFGKFYQAEESHSQKGNGIGLAIVKRVVELHGGNISVVSRDGVTSFTVEFFKDHQ